MYTFLDYYGREVKLAFEHHPFSDTPLHVWVICRFHGQWLLTNHQIRGLEFPGGKVESGETAEQAAIREVAEETGATIEDLYYIGQYHVAAERLCKNIYYAEIAELHTKSDYMETSGPVCLEDFPNHIKSDERFSFIMKDDVLTHSLSYIQTLKNH